jgi:hypothetical protein
MSGCAAQKPMYYYGDYSQSLYALKKEPTDETKKQHIEVLQNIMTVTKEDGYVRVPPGIYAEYGYMMHITGKTTEAIKYFALEKQTYPESGLLMDRLIQMATPKAAVIQPPNPKPALSAPPAAPVPSAKASTQASSAAAPANQATGGANAARSINGEVKAK